MLINGTVIYDSSSGVVSGFENHIGNINVMRYKGYYWDEHVKMYYLMSRFYDPSIYRFISADDVSFLDLERYSGLNLFVYCLNNPVMYLDGDGTSPTPWQWVLSGLLIAGGVGLMFVPGGQAFGVSLMIAGGSMMTSNILEASGVESKAAMQIQSGLNFVAGAILLKTPFAGFGASLMGAGVLGLTGGYVTEALGWGYELGWIVGSITGSILGGRIYNGLKNSGRIAFKVRHDLIVNNPVDEFVTVGARNGRVVEHINRIHSTGRYNPITVIRLANGTFEITNGHHTHKALRGMKYVWIVLTK